MPSNTQKLEQLLKSLSSPQGASLAESLKSDLLDLVDRKSASVTQVESAVPLSASQKAEIIKELKSENHTFTVNPDLIGGLKLTIGDKVFDLSISAKLTAITSQL